MALTSRTLKAGLLLGWAAWLSVIVLTNIIDALKALDLLSDDWSLASGNWELIVQTTAVHDVPRWINAILFAGAIAWQVVATALLWRAFDRVRRGASPTGPSVMAAFTVTLALWFAFVIADEIFIAYTLEPTHWRLFIAMAATLLLLRLSFGDDEAPLGGE